MKPTISGVALEIRNVECNCCHEMTTRTLRYEWTSDGLWYDCTCNSTRLILLEEIGGRVSGILEEDIDN